MPKVVSIAGKSESGKTTLIEKLVPILKSRGYRLGVIKHAHHGFEIDRKGKDSYRHKKAGADAVLIVSPQRIAMIKDQEEPTSLDHVIKYLDDVDLVIAEGFKKEKLPKIEVFRKAAHAEPACLGDENLIAFVTDSNFEVDVPTFKFDNVEGLSDFIEASFLHDHSKV